MNSSEMFNREKKAARLTAVLVRAKCTAEDVRNASEEDWTLCAKAATKIFGETVNPPNPKNPQPTIEVILKMLARQYEWADTSHVPPELLAAIDRIDQSKWNTEDRNEKD